jgi:glycerophosphoryl diester phosphodiesterase
VTRGEGVRAAAAVFAADRPLVFAHRGGARLGPENTMPAFARGLDAGADGIECDVRLSADDVPVVIHDATLDRTTDRCGAVAALPASELARVDATCRYQPPADVATPTPRAGIVPLADMLHAFPRARLIVELKDDSVLLATAVADVVRRTGAAGRVCLGSFHRTVVRAVRAYAPELTTSASQSEARALLLRSRLRWPRLGRAPFCALQVPEVAGRLRVTSPGFFRQVHREGCVAQVWTVDDADDVRRLFDWGADGVITDRPDLVVPVRDAWSVRGVTPAL